MSLLARFSGRKEALAIEQTRGAVIHFLLGFNFVHVFRIHPKSLKKFRDALQPSGAKDYPTDAELPALPHASSAQAQTLGPGQARDPLAHQAG
jgi:hypothetical protein